jgi:hypothetical protein
MEVKMILQDIIYEDAPFWVTFRDGYFHVYEDLPCMGYAEHRLLTDSFDEAKKFIHLQKK